MKNRHLYHAKWSLISRLIRLRRAGNRCEQCGVENHSWIARFQVAGIPAYVPAYCQENEVVRSAEDGKVLGTLEGFGLVPARWVKVVLTVAHLDQNRANNRFSNLKALCQRCHFAHDRQANTMRRKLGQDCYDRPNLFTA